MFYGEGIYFDSNFVSQNNDQKDIPQISHFCVTYVKYYGQMANVAIIGYP